MRHKVGDIVKIREWDDMAEEFGRNIYGDIEGEDLIFPMSLKKYCGKEVKIKYICGFGVYAIENIDWYFTDKMFTDWENVGNMKNYKDVTLVEYMQKKKKEMLINLGSESGRCNYRMCKKCRFKDASKIEDIPCDEWEINHPEEAAKIVMEYEPEVDWSKVPVDTKVLVRNSEKREWIKGHFAKLENGEVYIYDFGRTSFTTNCIVSYKHAKLYKEEL